ncbi:MAG: DNA helicase UvrD, partial [Thioalkalivibrio sp.]
SVIRRAAIAMPWSTRLPWRRMADDGLRPLPPYASFMVGGGRAPWR